MSVNKEYFCVNYTGRKGGGPLDAIEMTKGLIHNNVPVIAIISEEIENLSDWMELPIDVIVVKGNKNLVSIMLTTLLFPFISAPRIRKQVKQYDVRYVYCPMGSLWTHRINALFSNSIKMGVIHDPVVHSGDEWMARLFKDDTHRYDLLAVHTEKFKQFIQDKYSLPTYYIPLGRHDMYKRCKNKTKIVSYDKERINFLFFGRISKYKGLETLAQAYKRLTSDEVQKYTLTIIGAGDFTPYSELYRDLPDVNIINRWIKDEEVEGCFKGENVIAICPYHEASQSGVVLVAMDYNVPLIVTNVGGMTDQVLNGETGIVIEPDNEQELTDAMRLLANNRELRISISNKQKEAVGQYSWNNSAKIVIEAMKSNALRKD